MTTPIRVLGIPGSLRKKSFNRGLLRAATEMLPEGMSLDVYDLEALPLYNGDVEAAGLPEPVQDFQRRIEAADALLFATPEYNSSIPGALKNALDWLSRPFDATPLRGKPVLQRRVVRMVGESRQSGGIVEDLRAANFT